MKIHTLNADGVSLGHADGKSRGTTACGRSGYLIFKNDRRWLVTNSFGTLPLVRLHTKHGGGPVINIIQIPLEEPTCLTCLRRMPRATPST